MKILKNVVVQILTLNVCLHPSKPDEDSFFFWSLIGKYCIFKEEPDKLWNLTRKKKYNAKRTKKDKDRGVLNT